MMTGRGGCRWVRTAVLGAGVLGLLVLPMLASPVQGQRAEVVALVGFYTPLRSLGTADRETGEMLRLGKRETSLAYGFAVEVGSRLPVGLRGGVLFGTSGDIPIEGPECDLCETQGNVRAITGALVLRPFRGLPAPIRPYLLAGGGFKRYGLDNDDLKEVGIDGAVDDHTNGTWQLGAGVGFSLGVTQVLIEISDFISDFDVTEGRGAGKTQHDLFFTLGLRL